MEDPLSDRWTEFDKMIRQLGALSLDHECLLSMSRPKARTHLPKAHTHLKLALEEAIRAVCRFSDDQSVACATEAWAAIHRAQDAARYARSRAGKGRSAEDQTPGRAN
jgi:hypothetical protein